MNSLYLLDAAVTETNAIKLRFLKADGRLVEFVDDKYRPYFFVPYPPTTVDREIIKHFSGEARPTEKADLFTNEKRMLTKICWPNPRISSKAAERFGRCWEKEIEFTRSYVYDKGLIFGASYSEDGLRSTSDTQVEAKEELEETFKETQMKDPLKYAQIAHWFDLLNQPIPTISPELLGIKEVMSEKLHTAWMLSRIANMPLREAYSSRRVSDWIKPMIYTYLRRYNILIPTAEELRRERPTHAVTGALTVSPKAGIYFNTVVCDFESLYPSCIDSFNLSYETVDCPHPECRNNRIPDVDYHVCSRQRGFYSILVGALKELRIKIFKPASKDNSLPGEKRMLQDAAAKLLKLILVSSYGVTVRIHGVACPPLAETITGYGRYVLKESWKLAEQGGLRPLYGDTDSLFLDNVVSDQVGWLIRTVRERFSLDLAVDKHYSICVLPKAKKAYFGILPDGTPDIKGVTAIKSNSPAYIKNVFQQCVRELSGVENQNGYERAKERMKAIVRKSIVNLRNRSVKLEDLTYSVRLYFDPSERAGDMKALHQPYQCALQLIDAGRKLSRGETVSFVKVKPFNHKEKIFTVKPVGLVTSLSEINTDDYVRNLLTALNQTFEPIGITLETEKERETQISRWLTD